jgi:hypothetical protein
MTPEEIVQQIKRINRHLLKSRAPQQTSGSEHVLALMDAAALRGFQLGSNVAMAMVQGSVLVQTARAEGERSKGTV